jgi:hypothetical protein
MSVRQSGRNGSPYPIMRPASGIGGSRPETDSKAGNGPYDSGDAPDDTHERLVDFWSLRVPVPADAQARAAHRPHERWAGVHIQVPRGYLRLHALAAPRSSSLWDQLSQDIVASLEGKTTRVLREQGRWGSEVVSTSDDTVTRFIGVDGPRWTLYGVATGPVAYEPELTTTLRTIMRGTIVIRGNNPLPVNSGLPLTNPDSLGPDPNSADEASTERAAAAPLPPSDGPSRPGRSIGRNRLTQPQRAAETHARAVDPPTVPIPVLRRTNGSAPRGAPARADQSPLPDEGTRRLMHERLVVLEAVIAALTHYRQLIAAIAQAEDRAGAIASIRALLGVDETPAHAVLALPWGQLTSAQRRAVVAERDELLSALYAADWDWS